MEVGPVEADDMHDQFATTTTTAQQQQHPAETAAVATTRNSGEDKDTAVAHKSHHTAVGSRPRRHRPTSVCGCCCGCGVKVHCGDCVPMPSVSALVVAIAATVVVANVAVIFTGFLLSLNGKMEGFIEDFGEAATGRATYHVTQRYEHDRLISQLAHRVCNEIDVVPDLDDPELFLKWFGSYMKSVATRLVYARSNREGFVVGLQSGRAPRDFPPVAGLAVMERLSPVNPVVIRYVNLTTMATVPGSIRVYPNIIADIHKLTYDVFFRVSSPQWIPPFVSSVLSTSVFGIGANFSVPNSNITGQCSVFDVSLSVAEFLQSLNLTRSGLVMVVDVATRAFIGGNFLDNATIVSNATTGSYRLATVDDFTQPLAATFWAASRAAGGVALTCAVPCTFLLMSDGHLRPGGASTADTLFSTFNYVQVSGIQDDVGLSVRIVVMIPSTDFVSGMVQAVKDGLLLSGVSVAVLLLAAALGMHLLLMPLRRVEHALITIAACIMDPVKRGECREELAVYVSVRADPSSFNTNAVSVGTESAAVPSSHAMGAGRRRYRGRSLLRELSRLESASLRLLDEMSLIASFVNHEAASVRTAAGSARGVSHHAKRRQAQSQSQPAAASGGGHEDSNQLTVGTHTSQSRRIEVPAGLGATIKPPQREVSLSAGEGPPSATIFTPQLSIASAADLLSGGDETPSTDHVSAILPLTYERTVTYTIGTAECLRCPRRELLPLDLQRVSAMYVDTMTRLADAHGGVVGSFYGDRVYMHFNATGQCSNHTIAASRAVVQFAEVFSQRLESAFRDSSSVQKHDFRASFGVATGRAICGVLGGSTGEWQTFHVMGDCVQRAHWLASIAMHGGFSHLVSHKVAQDVMSAMTPEEGGEGSSATLHHSPLSDDPSDYDSLVARHVRIVVLPGGGGKTIASTLTPRRKVNSEKMTAILKSNAVFEAKLTASSSSS